MSERACIRGCTVPGKHYASCPDYGVGEGECRGCAPVQAQDGVLVCADCYRRIGRLLRDAPDLVGRMRSTADPSKAKVPDGIRRAAASTPPDPIVDELLDAIIDVQGTLRSWAAYAAGKWPGRAQFDTAAAFDAAARQRLTIDGCLDAILNRRDTAMSFCAAVVDRHDHVDGVRSFWSIADARAQFGIERRTREDPDAWSDVDESPTVLSRTAIVEYGDPLLTMDQARIVVGSKATLYRWLKGGLIVPAAEIWIAGKRTRMFRRSDLIRAAGEARARTGGRPPKPAAATSPAQMMWPMKCRWCAHIHDAGNVEIVQRYLDCSVWRCPGCGALIDDRTEAWGGSAFRVDAEGREI